MLTPEERAMSYYRAVYRAVWSAQDGHGEERATGIYLDPETGEYAAATTGSAAAGWIQIGDTIVPSPAGWYLMSEEEFVNAAMDCWGVEGMPAIAGEEVAEGGGNHGGKD